MHTPYSNSASSDGLSLLLPWPPGGGVPTSSAAEGQSRADGDRVRVQDKAQTADRAGGASSGGLGQPRPGSLRRRVANSSPDMARRCQEELPATVRELLRLLGDLDTVLELVALFGGGTWYIPTVWPLPGTRGGKTTHPLRRVLTQEQMTGLTRYYGGTQLYIPRCQRALQRLRNARIILSFSAGVAKGRSSRDLVRRLALRHNLTDRRVWDILKIQV